MPEGEPVPNIEAGVFMHETLGYADSLLDGPSLDLKPLGKDDESHDPMMRFSGPLVDFNEPLTEADKQFAREWITRRLGSDPSTAPISHRYVSPDGLTRINRYAHPLDSDNGRFFLSEVQTEGQESLFVMWPEEMYDMQTEMSGYTIQAEPESLEE